ncbi:hypothetical protein VTG60DRAFT_6196 [Thermothelomyces hinnuleus]
MRFINSLAFLSLSGLALALPVVSDTDDLVSGTDDSISLDIRDALSGLTDSLTVHNSKDHKHDGASGLGLNAGRARRRSDDEGSNGSDGQGSGYGNSHGKEGEGDSKLELKKKHGETNGNQKDSDHGFTRGIGHVKRRGHGRSKRKCNNGGRIACLRPDDVDTLVDAYVRMLSSWNDTHAEYLADDFVDTSDSINILAGIPLGSPTFLGRAAFIDHQHTQPDNLPLEVTHKSPISCDEIALIWQATFGFAEAQVRGLTILGATRDAGYWQIATVDVEFNSLAYLLDIGGSYSLPGH